MSRFLLAALLGVATTITAAAGPDQTANRFLNDSPSMLDWGLDRLERHILAEGYGGDVAATYDWDRNLILIYRHEILAPSVDERDYEAVCRDWFGKVRSNGYVLDTGELLGGFKTSRYAALFGHTGFERVIGGIEEEAALQALDGLIQIEYKIWELDADRTAATAVVECSGKLLDTGFSVKRN